MAAADLLGDGSGALAMIGRCAMLGVAAVSIVT